MKEEIQTNILNSIEFILRHPWLFISPFVIIISVTFAQLANIKLMYQSNAVISLEGRTEYGKMKASDYKRTAEELYNKFVSNDNVAEIIKEVWPEVNISKNPQEYESLFKSVKDNIDLEKDKNNDLININYKADDPKICHKVVKTSLWPFTE